MDRQLREEIEREFEATAKGAKLEWLPGIIRGYVNLGKRGMLKEFIITPEENYDPQNPRYDIWFLKRD